VIRRAAPLRRLPIVLGIAVLCGVAAERAAAGPRARRQPPRLVLHSADSAERMVTVEDLSFAYFRRVFYTRSASRAESLSRQRMEIQDRREECLCLRLSDWSKIKFKKLRQIEITYPEGSRLALLRLTRHDGRVSEVSAGTLFGAADPFPPRFGATVDGLYREFPLALEDSVAGGWPRELLSRVLLVTSPPPRQSRSGRR
jgi:hypothetical protein